MNKFVNKRKVAEETLVSEIMTKDVKVVRETEYVLDWFRIMSNGRFRRLPVVDESGQRCMPFSRRVILYLTLGLILLFQANN